MRKGYIITVDGPAGAGKSTVARLVAEKASFLYLDTGAMYRSVAYLSGKNGQKFSAVAEDLVFDIISQNDAKRIIANGMDVTDKIRTPDVDFSVSAVADDMDVRKILVAKQREFARGRNVILDGRDTGTVVFPDADLKFYLDASVEVRAKRRFLEQKDGLVSEEDIAKDIIRRDHADKNRAWGALKVPHDGIIIDTGNMTIEEVADEILSHVEM